MAPPTWEGQSPGGAGRVPTGIGTRPYVRSGRVRTLPVTFFNNGAVAER